MRACNATWVILAETVIRCIPVVGQLVDARDIIKGFVEVAANRPAGATATMANRSAWSAADPHKQLAGTLNMATPLNPQEIFLIERYTSDEYFWQMREAWAEMVKLGYECLDIFMRNLPADYRKRQLPYQHDVVWGERILPNFQSGLDYLNKAWILLSRGDKSGLAYTGSVSSNVAGYIRDYNTDLMREPPVLDAIPDAESRFKGQMTNANRHASNMDRSVAGALVPGSLTVRFYEDVRGSLGAPSSWPVYRLNDKVRVRTGDDVKVSGIYLPDADHSIPVYMIAGFMPAHQARIGFNPDTDWQREKVDTTWTLVERIADSGGGTPGAPDAVVAGIRLRAAAGEACPCTGWWVTPAAANSRRRFQTGEPMPDLRSSWGATIWQWDDVQG